MCQKIRKTIKKGSTATRQREARRLQRLQRETPSPPITSSDDSTTSSTSSSPSSSPLPSPPHGYQIMDKELQKKVILALAWKTVLLMRNNQIIQQKMAELHNETKQFVEKVMSNPENKRRYDEHVKLHGPPNKHQTYFRTNVSGNVVSFQNIRFICKTESKQ